MKNRKGEKIGWIGGWLGSYSWVLVLSIVFFAQGKASPGFYGILIFLIAVIVMYAASPWRNPKTPYWQLLLPFYLLFTSAVIWVIKSYGQSGLENFSWFQLLPILPVFLPLFILGNKKWDRE